MAIDLATVEEMAAKGIEFGGNVRTIYGGKTYWLEPGSVQRFVADPIQYAADENGVTKSVYLEWLESFGCRFCTATTKGGKKCKNLLSHGQQMELTDWVRRDGEYCAIHGGKTSRKR